jgi:large subunit ribosomal protein L13
MNKTYTHKPADIKRQWHLVDAEGQILGRMATQIAVRLMGKDKPTYTPNFDGGDFVVVVNAAGIKVTGNKLEDKMYYRHSHQPGGLKKRSLSEMMEWDATEVIRLAVYNMLPKNKLRTDRMNRLKIYAGAEHQHQSQLGEAVAPATV